MLPLSTHWYLVYQERAARYYATVLLPNSSWPGLARPSTCRERDVENLRRSMFCTGDVDGRDKPGHDARRQPRATSVDAGSPPKPREFVPGRPGGTALRE